MKKPNFKKSRRILYPILILAILIYYYIFLPPIHYASGEFWTFLFLVTIGIVLIELIADGTKLTKDIKGGLSNLKDLRF